ncbi:MAG: chromophore lyase CpcT/CpeT [Candidatus Sericytochromatia bacterium]|nr:chromophore lyase CpcT/CpeT [Candidatus Sericytochromatia bacterium]
MFTFSHPMTRSLPLFALLTALSACGTTPTASLKGQATVQAQGMATQATLNALANKMIGVYDSKDQALADPENYRDVTLHMVRVWPERKDGPWLYIEQALSKQVQLPYRQRVYRLLPRTDGRVASEVYTLPEPVLKYAGAWRQANPLGDLKPADLTPRTGCAVVLRQTSPGIWAGGTVGRECPSELYGAAYATSEVVVSGSTLKSWDRGYDANGEQVWGAEKGGYVFIKRSVR